MVLARRALPMPLPTTTTRGLPASAIAASALPCLAPRASPTFNSQLPTQSPTPTERLDGAEAPPQRRRRARMSGVRAGGSGGEVRGRAP
jgi:hypothetical protein